MALPQYKHGRHSKYLPTKYLEAYQAAQEDPNLLSMSAEIQLTDSLIAKLLENLDASGSAARWEKLTDALRRRRNAQAKGAGGIAEFQAALDEMDRLIEEGNQDAENRQELSKHLLIRARLVDSETKRIKLAADTIAGDQAMGFVVALSNIVKSHVTEPRLLTAISADIARLLDRH